MITLENASLCFVGLEDETELGFTNQGTWRLPHAVYVSAGTNASVDTAWVRDGAIIVVDSDGVVTVSDGPNLQGVAIYGFVIGLFVIGTLLFSRWMVATWGGMAGLPKSDL